MIAPELVAKARALLAKGRTNSFYFFEKLSSPDWIAPLAEAGFFKEPPPGGLVWPESRYLVRMSERYPEAVRPVVLAMPQTANITVHGDIVTIASKLPARDAGEIAVRFLPSLEKSGFAWVDDQICGLITKLAEGGEAETAIRIAAALLAVMPPTDGGSDDAEGVSVKLEGCRTHLRSFEYGQCVAGILPALATASGINAIGLFGRLLSEAILYGRIGRNDAEDYSDIWMGAIDWPTSTHSEIKSTLADAVRSAAELVMKGQPPLRPAVLDYLGRMPYKIFRRIKWHLLGLFPDEFAAQLNEIVGSRENYEDPTVSREYRVLVAKSFRILAPDVQRKYLDWVGEPLDLAAEKQRWRNVYGRDVPDREIEVAYKGRMLGRLSGLKDFLPRGWRTRYDILTGELGQPPHPSTPPPTMEARVVAPVSPLKACEMAAMSNSELIGFLKTWKPPPREVGAHWRSPEGVGRVLAEVAAQDPTRLLDIADGLRELDPTYVRHILEGLLRALAAEKVFAWGPVIGLCSWVMQQDTGLGHPEAFDHEADRDWRWAQGEAASLVEAGMGSRTNPLPLEFRAQVWEILLPRTRAADPAPSRDEKAVEEGTDLIHITLNSERGRAMRAVVDYALWLRRHFEGSGDLAGRIGQGFDAMPEVREVLEAHLDPRGDPSPAIRAIYGEFYPWLVMLDEKWASGARSKIFPHTADQAHLRCAAWGAYIVSCPPYDRAVEILRPEYVAAIADMGRPKPYRILGDADPDVYLADHLIQLYGRGALSSDDELWARFWRTAPEPIRAHAIAFVGRTLEDKTGTLPGAVQDRFIALCETRIQAAEGGANRERFLAEMRAFGWWFANPVFEVQWSLERLNRILDLTRGQVDAGFALSGRLAQAAGSSPVLTATCLRKMVEGATEVWGVVGQHEDILSILRTAKDSDQTPAYIEAHRVAGLLVEKGFVAYRSLFPE